MWGVSSSGSSRSHRSANAAKYQSGLGDFEDEDDVAVDYPCPFCSDDYDLVELCHHIDEEHHLEVDHGICPVCSKRVKMHMVDHITTHHRDVLKSEQKEISYRENPYSSDKYLQSLLDELPISKNHHHTSKSVVSDQFLSFINNSPLRNQTKPVQADSGVEDKNSMKDSFTEKDGKSLCPLSDTERMEKAKKCEFVQGLLSTAMLDDGIDF